MFTGIIEEIGKIRMVKSFGGGKRISVLAGRISEGLNIGDSVSIDGVCQTVTVKGSSFFEVEAVEETIRKTNFGQLKAEQPVNLERALRPSDRLGGHLVMGHVDCTALLLSVIPEGMGKQFRFDFPSKYSKYLLESGSIAINGVSLTLALIEESRFMVSVIPHSFENTCFKFLKPGVQVNLEFDLIGKYIERMMKERDSAQKNKQESGIFAEFYSQP